MSAIYVCSLDKLSHTAANSGASHVATLINANTDVTRPESVSEQNHLFLGFNDIAEPTPGFTIAGEEHVRAFMQFVSNWDQKAPLIVHCWAGVSRSTAGAMIATCLLQPELDEEFVAQTIRKRSPEATPNKRLVSLADDILNRQGRMVDAVTGIGRGADCYEGSVFQLNLAGASNGKL